MPRVPTLLFFGDVFFIGLALALGSPVIGLGAAALGGAVAVLACELLARDGRRPELPREPWRLDAWSVTIATLAVVGLAASIGPEGVGVAWLLVALIAGLGFASLPNLAPRPRS